MRRDPRQARHAVPALIAATLVSACVALSSSMAAAGRPQALALVAEGDALAAAGDRDGALIRYRGAVVEDADLLIAYEHAVPLWFETQRWAEAATYLERATVRHPEWAQGWYALGFVYRKSGKYEAAIIAYTEFAMMRPGEASPWYGLGVAYELSGDVTGAVRAWRQYLALEADPAKESYRVEARRAIDRLLGPPKDWRDAFGRLIVDGGATSWRRVIATVR